MIQELKDVNKEYMDKGIFEKRVMVEPMLFKG